MIFMRLYAKNETEDITAKEKKTLAAIASAIKTQFRNTREKGG